MRKIADTLLTYDRDACIPIIRLPVISSRSKIARWPLDDYLFSRSIVRPYPMQSAILLRVSRTVTARSSIVLSHSTRFGQLSTLDIAMAQRIFKGHNDHYNGITIDSVEEACDNKVFTQRLKGRDTFRPFYRIFSHIMFLINR